MSTTPFLVSHREVPAGSEQFLLVNDAVPAGTPVSLLLAGSAGCAGAAQSYALVPSGHLLSVTLEPGVYKLCAAILDAPRVLYVDGDFE